MSSSTLRCPRHHMLSHTGPVFLNTRFVLAGSHDETVNRPHAGVKKLCRFAPQPYMPDPCGWTAAPNRRMWMTRFSLRTAFIVFVDRSLVWCIRSSLGNAGVIDADPLLWFVQVSGSLSTQKAPE